MKPMFAKPISDKELDQILNGNLTRQEEIEYLYDEPTNPGLLEEGFDDDDN